MDRKIEFLVDSFFAEDGLSYIRGACNHGPILLGDVFTSAIEVGHPDSEARGIALTVEQIVTYRHKVDQLPQGMTGELLVHGENLHLVQEGDRLRALL